MDLLGQSLYKLRIYVERELKKNLTAPFFMGYEGNKNKPRYLLFNDSILRHRVTIRVG